MDFKDIIYSKGNGIAHITINRPDSFHSRVSFLHRLKDIG